MGAPKGNKFAEGNKGGRPTKFRGEFIQQLIDFFSIEPYTKELMEEVKEYYKDGELKKESTKYKHIPSKLPTLYQFSKKIGVSYSTVYRWAEKGEDQENIEELKGEYTDSQLEEIKQHREQIKEFCNAYKEAKELQKEFLISIGLSGAAPSPAFIFTAKNITDMRDKQELDHTSKGEKITNINYIIPNGAESSTDNQATSGISSS